MLSYVSVDLRMAQKSKMQNNENINMSIQYVIFDFDIHLHNMYRTDGHTSSYATEAEIIAIANLLNCQIVVGTTIHNQELWVIYGPDQGSKGT